MRKSNLSFKVLFLIDCAQDGDDQGASACVWVTFQPGMTTAGRCDRSLVL